MILYLDTSALIKKYFKESHSNEVISKWREATEIITSSVTFAETMAAFYRKKREANLRNKVFAKIVDSFQLDWDSFIRVEVNEDLNQPITTIISKHPLRGFDAIHLVSALIVYEKDPENFLFICYDHKLTQAAKKEGLNTFPANV